MSVDGEYTEDLSRPALPDWAEDYFGEQRTFWRTLRHGGLLTGQGQALLVRRLDLDREPHSRRNLGESRH